MPRRAQALARMSDTERALFRDGYASRMKEVIANQSDRADLVKKIAHTPAAREKMELALGRQRANELIAMMHGESIMQKLTASVQGNSSSVMQLIGYTAAGAGGGGYLGYDPDRLGDLDGLVGRAQGPRRSDGGAACGPAVDLARSPGAATGHGGAGARSAQSGDPSKD